jgi:ribosomal protein L29
MSKRKEQLERLRDLPGDELRAAVLRTQDERFRLQLGHYTNQVENTMSIRAKRRELARVLTILRAREMGLETQQAPAAKAAAKVAAKAEARIEAETETETETETKTETETETKAVARTKAKAKASKPTRPKAKAKPKAKSKAKDK